MCLAYELCMFDKNFQMKNIYLLLILVSIAVQLNAQIVINEIMYNPPESGADYLEYIEFYNNSASSVNIKNYSIEDAVIMNFPDTTIPAFGYFLIAVDSSSLDSILGVKSFEWSGGALRNSDEIITLLDENKNVVDSVHYYVSWSSEANGNGSSLELCRPNVDNYQSIYWRPSHNNTGIFINSRLIQATPGYKNSSNCGDHNVFVSDFKFNPVNLEIYTGEQVEWSNQQGLHNINGSKSIFPDNPEEFGNGAPSSNKWTYVYKFNSPGIYKYQCDVHVAQGMTGTITVRNKDIAYPNLKIGVAKTTDQNGVLDSINKQCALEGIVYGVNLRPNGLQFTIIDQYNDGIGVFKSSGSLGYTVQEGDFLIVKGILNQFNGLAQISPDSITKISSGNNLFLPTLVDNLDESTESQLIRMKNVELVDPQAWTNNPLGFTVKITDGIGEWDLRIDNDVSLHGTSAPFGKFHITGIGSQFDVSSPFLESYQIIPRYVNDLELITSVADQKVPSVNIYPQPVIDLLNIFTTEKFDKIILTEINGRILYQKSFSDKIHLDLKPGIYYLNLLGKTKRTLKMLKL